MSTQLSDELLAIAERVCRQARERGKSVFTVYHEESDLSAEPRPGAPAGEMEHWLT